MRRGGGAPPAPIHGQSVPPSSLAADDDRHTPRVHGGPPPTLLSRAAGVLIVAAYFCAATAVCVGTTWGLPVASVGRQAAPSEPSAPACSLRVVSIGAPTRVRGNCSAARADRTLATIQAGFTPGQMALWARYQILASMLPYAAAHSPPPLGGDVVLIDDIAFLTSFWCFDAHDDDFVSYDEYMEGVQALMEERAERVAAQLALGRPVVLVDTVSILPEHHVRMAHPLLYRLELEVDNVEPEERARVASYLIVPYVAPMHQPTVVVPLPLAPPPLLRPRGRIRGGAGASARPPHSLLFFKAGCSDSESVGMRMRHHFITALTGEAGVTTACAGADSNASLSPGAYLRELRGSRFCLVLPGDTPSSSRLSEVMLVGCIPVFAGPPWVLLPLLPAVPYQCFALFFRMASAVWINADDAALLANPNDIWAEEPRQAQFLASLGSAALEADDVGDMLRQLRVVTDERAGALAAAAAPYRPLFASAPTADSEGAARLLRAACVGAAALTLREEVGRG